MARFFLLCLCSFLILSCSKDKDVEDTITPEKATFNIITQDVENIEISSALLKAQLIIKGQIDVQEIGFCWDESPQPTTIHQKYSIGSLKGQHKDMTLQMNHILEELDERTEYYVRSYAIINGEIHYGEEKVFTTLALEGVDQFWSFEDNFDHKSINYFNDTSTKVLVFFEANANGDFCVLKYKDSIQPDKEYQILKNGEVPNDDQVVMSILLNGQEWNIPSTGSYVLKTTGVGNKIVIEFKDVDFVNESNSIKKSSALVVIN